MSRVVNVIRGWLWSKLWPRHGALDAFSLWSESQREQRKTVEVTNQCLNCGTMRVTILTDQEIANEPNLILDAVARQQHDMARHLRVVHGAVL